MNMYLRNGKRLKASASGGADGANPDNLYPNGRSNGHQPAMPTSVTNGPVSRIRKTEPLVTGAWNVRSIGQPGKKELLVDELYRWKVDIAALSETRTPGTKSFMQCGTKPDVKCKFYLSGLETSSDHGVGFAVKSTLVSCIEEFRPISNRIALLKLRSDISTSVIAAYAPTNVDLDAAKDAFYETLSEILEENKHRLVILLGDFNAEVGSDRSGWEKELGNFGIGGRNDNGQRLLSLASTFRLGVCNSWFRHNTRLSWHSNDGKTHKLLDYALVSRRFGSSVKNVKVLPASSVGSDHDLVICKIQLRLKRKKKKAAPKKYDWDALAKDSQLLENYQTKLSNNFQSADEGTGENGFYSAFKNSLHAAASAVCPLKRWKTRPWISDETLDLVTERHKAKSEGNRSRVNYLSRKIKKRLKSDEESFWMTKAAEIETADPISKSGKIFAFLNDICGSRKALSSAIRDSNGVFVSGEDEKRDRWAEHFEDLYNRPQPPALDQSLDLPPPEPAEIRIDPPDMDEVRQAIRALKPGKSPGPDSVTPEMLKFGGEACATKVHELIGHIWRTETFPSDLKNGTIVPVHKKNDEANCANYRGISLLSIVGKVLMIIIRRRITPHREATGSEEQAGFRQGRGCTDQIYSLRSILERRIRYGKPIITTFVDFAAAFDSVHRPSMWKLLEQNSIPAKIVRLLRSYYTDAVSNVRAYGDLSRDLKIETGVRQGCILSPSLFNVVIDRILSNLDAPGVSVDDILAIRALAYADDIALLAETEQDMQMLLDQLKDAAAKFGMTISGPKTKVIYSGLEREPCIHLNSVNLEVVPAFKYLGSTITGKTTHATDDIHARIGKAAGVYARLKKSLWSRPQISLNTKLQVYNSMILPVLLYGSEAWTLRNEDLRCLEVFHMARLRWILGVKLRDRISNIEVRRRCFNSLTIDEIISKGRLRWFGHVCRMNPVRYPNRILRSDPPRDWRVSRRAPRKTWLAQIEQDTTRLHFSLQDAMDIATRRDQWNGFLRDLHVHPPTTRQRTLPYRR